MEFQKFCKDFNRMCKECDDEDNPFRDAAESDFVEDWLIWAMNNPDEAEDYVNIWARNNPEPVYPTFGDYLRTMAGYDHNLDKIPLSELLNVEIPKDIAERYEVVPLNPCGVQKYVSDWL